MTKKDLIRAIEVRMGGTFPFIWTCGITASPDVRRMQHAAKRSVRHWRHWRANSANIARAVERHFLSKGCRGGPGGPGEPRYVYLF